MDETLQHVYEENGVIYDISNKPPDLEEALYTVKKLEELTNHFQMDPVLMLTDVSGSSVGMIRSDALKIFIQAAKNLRNPRIAVVAKLALARVIINMLVKATGHGNWKIFGDREAALKWLKQ